MSTNIEDKKLKDVTLAEIKEYYHTRYQEELAALGETEIDFNSRWCIIKKEGDKEIGPYLAIANLEGEKISLDFKTLKCSEEKEKGTKRLTYKGALKIGTILGARIARKDNSEPIKLYYQVTAEGLREIPNESVRELLGAI